MPNLRQIAKLCNVSPVTVSAVLNNRSGAFSEETRERVLQAVRQSGYRPRATTRVGIPVETDDTVVPTTHAIGITVPGDYRMIASAGYYGEIFKAILNATHRLGIDVLLAHGSIYRADSYHSIRSHFDGHCEGLLCIAPYKSAPLIAALQERGFPCVLIGDTGDSEAQSYVDVDNATGVRLAVTHLLELGHRHIGFVGGPVNVRSAAARHDSYRDTLEAAGIAYDPTIVQLGTYRLVEHYQFVASLMQRKDRELPTAFVCWNDTAARRAINALSDLDKLVPEHVSVIGFDDCSTQVGAHPQLTSIRQPYREIGETAVQMLVDLIDAQNTPPRGKLVVPSLVTRDSTAPVYG